MKQFFLLLAFFGLAAIAHVEAQNCAESPAAKAAALDANIVQKVNHSTGEVTYLRKNVCPSSGKVSYAPVEYCTKSGRFITAASTKKETCVKKQACTGYYGASAMAGSSVPEHCTSAQKAACVQANQKAALAKAAFVANTSKTIKP